MTDNYLNWVILFNCVSILASCFTIWNSIKTIQYLRRGDSKND